MLVSSKQEKESQSTSPLDGTCISLKGQLANFKVPRHQQHEAGEREMVSKEEKHYFRVTHLLHTEPFGPWFPQMPPNSTAPSTPAARKRACLGPQSTLTCFSDKSWQGMLYAQSHRKKPREARTKPPAEAAQDSQHPPCCLLTQSVPTSLLRHEAKTA